MRTSRFFHIRLLACLLGLSGGLLLEGCQRHLNAATATACIDPSKVNPAGICTMEYDPVCGCNGKTYANPCAAGNAGVRSFTRGACPASLRP